ncbi:MAG: hypothetical protein N2491_01625 [Negativicutes bacterium]|nr:hypothetical protein [Negativicutes bacterium]
MFRWLAERLRTWGRSSEKLADKAEQAESKLTALGWSLADIGAGFVAGIIFAKLVL